MIEKAFHGGRGYWMWLTALGAALLVGVVCYAYQFRNGLTVTGLSRDVTWGFYIAQFTFLVGVAASAVMVVLPYYLHNQKAFGRMTILGEFLAISAVVMCVTFIFVDMGQPLRILNVFLHPTPNSMMFWDTIALGGYLALNVLISRITLNAENKGLPPPRWIKFFIYLSIPWAISIHTVTAFLYSGLAARPFWMTAVLAPRFLASAFASGPALLILLVLLLRRATGWDAGREALHKLALIVTYAMALNIFFILMELFTAFYSGIPEHAAHFRFMLFGLDGVSTLVPWMWGSFLVAGVTLIILVNPRTRKHEAWLAAACLMVFISIWIDKGMGMIVTGFVPSPLGEITQYIPTVPELGITLGVYALGGIMITGFYKMTLAVKRVNA